MNLRNVGFGLLITGSLMLAGCSQSKKDQPADGDSAKVSMSDTTDSELKALFNLQIQSLKAKNSADYLKTIRVNGLDSINALHYFESVTGLYDLDYTIRDFKVLRNDGNNAEVEVEMEVRKVNGPDFEDHIAVTRHIIGKTPEGGWIILESREMKYTRLN